MMSKGGMMYIYIYGNVMMSKGGMINSLQATM